MIQKGQDVGLGLARDLPPHSLKNCVALLCILQRPAVAVVAAAAAAVHVARPLPPLGLLSRLRLRGVAERALAVFLAPFRNATSRAKVRNCGRAYDRVGSRRARARGRACRRLVGTARRTVATAVAVTVVGPL